MEFSEGCSICGQELKYDQDFSLKHCSYCGNEQDSNVECPQGHFICDNCHRSNAIQLIETYCNNSQNTDPMEMAVFLMRNPIVKMHGPEHHFLVPAVLVAAYYNSEQNDHKKRHKLAIARKRAETVPGGYCGSHGTCGAAVGTGIFISIITGATPLHEEEWALSNMATGEALLEIACQGGPRCCKRDSFTAIKKAVKFLKNNLNKELPVKEIECEFSGRNKQCKFDDCLYFPS